jgi:hypothetical protein
LAQAMDSNWKLYIFPHQFSIILQIFKLLTNVGRGHLRMLVFKFCFISFSGMEEINPFQNVSVDPVNYPRWQPLLKMPFFPLSIISNFWYLIQLIYIFWNNIDIFKTSWIVTENYIFFPISFQSFYKFLNY